MKEIKSLWNTEDEMRFIDYMSSPEPRENDERKPPTIYERRSKLQAYIRNAEKRIWYNMDVGKIIEYAQMKLRGLHD